MTTKDDQGSDLESLLESGQFDDNTDIATLEAALNGAPISDDDTGKGDEAANAGSKDQVGDEDKGGQPDDAAKAADQGGDKAGDAGGDEDESSHDTADFAKSPLYGVLKGTRAKLKAARDQSKADQQRIQDQDRVIQELQGKLTAKAPGAAQEVQDAADAAGMVDADGKPIDVATIDIQKLRGDYDGPIVDAIELLQNLVRQQSTVITDLRGREAVRAKSQEQTEAEQLQNDIDAVPQLAEWQADENSPMFEAAVAVDKGLRTRPEWQGRPRVERFQEAVRMLGGKADQQQRTQKGDARVADAIRRATERAAPTSLSELPSGTAAGQSDAETLENLDVTQLASKMERMTKDQQDALLARLG